MEEIYRFTEEALDALQQKDEKMKIAMLDIQKYFLSLLMNQNVIGTGRVKSQSSLKEKILRKSYHVNYSNGKELIDSLDDLIGVRIICLLHNEEEKIWNLIDTNFKENTTDGMNHNVNLEKNIFLDKIKLPVPQKNGHDIYKIQGYYLQNGERYNFELQIKSLVHMLWGEIEHMLFYKNYEYIIDNSFYSSVMNSMYHNLMNIDSQLKDITNQMQGKNDQVMFDELKRMLAKILYEKINPVIESLLGCTIDLRECYDSVIDVVLQMSYYFSYQECLEHVQEVVGKINIIETEKLGSDIPIYEYNDRFIRDDRIKKVSNVISNKSKENVYYRLFVFLVGEMCNKKGANDIIETITDYYLKILRYEDDLEEEDIVTIREEFMVQVIDGYVLDIIMEFDFYWIINHKSYLMQLIRASMSLVRGIDIDEGDTISKAVVLLKDILLLKTLLDKNQKIKEGLLQEIYEMSENEIWNKEVFRNPVYVELMNHYRIDESDSRKKLNEMMNSEEVGFCIINI